MQNTTELQNGSGSQGETELQAILAEVGSTKETAQGIAHDGPAPDADVSRLLAGLLGHLAEQLERVISLVPDATKVAGVQGSAGGHTAAAAATPEADEGSSEEDISPEDAPAQPANDPDAQGDR
jgi:hypothetical protein